MGKPRITPQAYPLSQKSKRTANALARPVWAGPIEATAIGNVLVQYIAAGKIANIREGRQVVAQSSHIRPYEPHQTNVWQAAYERFTTEIVV